MTRKEANTQFGEKVVEKACEMYETDFYKVFFDEDCKYEQDCPLDEDTQIEYLNRAKYYI